ncbi:AglZ/HisF2 family acetamidino modification protein [Asinibacterium sp. OR53]|uniref:AglZ/HisF2 family acetamidino modification protein n=1 Tax=Asinibacterium sp. OR53 TaxID=925409 RepID=UPI00047ECD79|nr:AglZ/HisF2 family acetamidino modification protein [Asinibacterium sp. OR53]
MLRPRVIPCLLVRNKGLVKTVQFKDGKYVGDPINAVKIFNEKAVDELMLLDIDATKDGRGPNFEMIRNIAIESRMPLCYGGGVKTVEDAKRIISLGAEKVAISSIAVENPAIVSEMARAIGSQSVIVVIDVKYRGLFNKAEVVIYNGIKSAGLSPVDFAVQCETAGAGEIVINAVDRDGMMNGYDIKLLREVRAKTTIPLTILGGAASLDDVKKVIDEFKVIGVAAGSIFVFKGKYKAVLINYPNSVEKKQLLS